MKNISMIDYILYITAKFASAFLRALPVEVSLKIGRFFGTLAYLFNYKRAKVAYSNIRAAFCKEKSPCEMRRMVKRLYRNFGETLVEVLRIPKVDKAYIEKCVEVENAHYVDEALARGKGFIFLTGHFGNWELSSITSAFKGFPLLVLAREQKMTRLNNALNAYRESKGCKVVKKGMATRVIYEHLGQNGIVGILSDQDAGKKGPFLDFFGRPTSTARGAFVLSQKTGAVIIPTFMARVKGPYHRLFLESPIEVAEGESDELEAMQRFASLLEKYIRRYPEQWLWLHKRWKSTTLRKVVILNDGKGGHLNQSLAVFEELKKCRREDGYADTDTKLKTIEVKYKTKAHRIALTALANFITRYSLTRMPSLKSCLAEDAYDELEKNYADIVISCGSKTAAVNVLFSRENNAKNIILMKPSLLSGRSFNLAIIPEHDKPAIRKNVVTTLGALNLITPEKLKNDLKLLERAITLDGKKSIGLFIGGENRHYTFDTPLMKGVLENIIGAARELDMNILVTTSRRTGEELSNFIRRQLREIKLAKLVIIANEQNPEWTVGGILAASNIVVVSGESSSMLSEAASSGKHVIVFRPIKKAKSEEDNKHEIFLNRLNSGGFVHISKIPNLKKDIVELANSKKAPKKLSDNERIHEAIRKIL